MTDKELLKEVGSKKFQKGYKKWEKSHPIECIITDTLAPAFGPEVNLDEKNPLYSRGYYYQTGKAKGMKELYKLIKNNKDVQKQVRRIVDKGAKD